MQFDLLIRGGDIIDGAGREPARSADVGVTGGRIVAVGTLDGSTAETVVDAAGKVVCPGFVDVHVHSEVALLGGPYRYGALLQGVTTQLLAPDGFGWAPLPPEPARQLWEYTLFAYGAGDLELGWPTAERYLALFEGNTPANVVPQVPHCAIRMRRWAGTPARRPGTSWRA